MGIGSLYIEDEVFGGNIDIECVVSQETHAESVKLLKETYSSMQNERYVDTLSLQKTVNDIIDEILRNYGTLINFYEIRTYDDHTFNHSVDVCILSILTGITLGYNRLKLRELGIGALLHDIGKVKTSKEILNKPGSLSPDELKQIRRHPEDGFNILRRYVDIPLLSAHIAFQHQERLDGSGYPRGLTGGAIHEYARLVMVADVFNALTSDRPYRMAYPVVQAIDIIKSLAGTLFEKEFVAALFSNISPFPAGTVVLLNTGEIGQVVKTDKRDPTRPVIKILFDRKSNKLSRPFKIDLSGEPSLSIVKILSEEKISELTCSAPQSGGFAHLDQHRQELSYPQDSADRMSRSPPVKKP